MSKGGRPSKQTATTVKKLEEVFALDGSVEEACFYAGISRETYYQWIKADSSLSDRFEALRNNPVLKARKTVVDSLANPDYAFRYLERKKKDEFSTRVENTGKDGKDLIPQPILGGVTQRKDTPDENEGANTSV